MIKYLELLKREIEGFEEFTLEKFDREWNEKAESLSKFASASGALDTRSIILQTVRTSSIASTGLHVFVLNNERTWMIDIYDYLKDGVLPTDP